MKLSSRPFIHHISGAALACASSALATLADYQTAVTKETSIISCYSFDRTNANDSLGLHNGTAQGAGFAEGIGSAGRGLLLSGSGRISLGLVSDFDFSDGTGSVEAWVRPGWPGTFSAYNPCIFADRNGGPVNWSVHMNGDKSGVGVWNGAFYRSTLDANAIHKHFLAMVGSAQAPALIFSRSGNQLTLSWPADPAGFTLVSAVSDALPANAWVPVPGVVNNSVTIPMTNSQKYYRLQK